MRPSAQALQFEMMRRMSPGEKLAAAAELRDTNIALLAAGIRARKGDLPPDELRLEIIRLILPQRLFDAAYPKH